MQEDSTQLMQQAVSQAASHTQELLDLCAQITADFRNRPTPATMTSLKTLLEGIACISEALQLTKPLQLMRGIEPKMEDMPPALQPLVAAMENRDWLLAGEVLQHELAPVLDRWLRDLERLSQGESGHAVV